MLDHPATTVEKEVLLKRGSERTLDWDLPGPGGAG